MASLKTTFITTVYNEEKTILEFLHSLFKQTKLPNEIIIVDAGSTDKTVELISQYLPEKEKNFKVKLLFKKGNRSVGRNTAIATARNQIILCSDAGCILDKEWIKNITKPFEKKDIDVVSGFYKPIAFTTFQKCLATYTSTMPDKIDTENFLPSSRSIAFKKSAWEKAGKYPEYLDYCEDLIFDKNMQKQNCKFIFVKEAFVYWTQRKNIFAAAKQFFLYAKGDGQAHFFRKQTPMLFLRYIFGLAILSLGLYFKQKIFIEAIPVLLILYIFWSIGKNYKYIQKPTSLFWLPTLQFVSDITVMIGTVWGIGLSLNVKKNIYQNKTITLLILLYVAICLSTISWGLPNNSHPFTYHMDEWAQAQSIRSLFRHGTPNISGSSHGVIFEYFLTGIYLIPFILLHIVNPFVIKSPFDFMQMQQRMFEILRFNTILNGILTIAVLSYIAKKFFYASNKLAALFLILTPVFLMPSIIFKYDIALSFWISLSLLFTFIFAKNPTIKLFIITSIIYALTVSIKLSALPLVPLSLVAFFLFYEKPIQNVRVLFYGLIAFVITFCITGIPDLIFGRGNYSEWLAANLLINPSQTTHNLQLGNLFVFLFLQQYPALFGHAFYIFFFISLIISIFYVFKYKFSSFLSRQILFLLLGVLFFAISLVPLQIGANSNRLLVFLPFFSILTSFIFSILSKKNKLFIFLIIILIGFQTIELLSWVSVRLLPTPRQTASIWILKNIPSESKIGIENVPIFQAVPDIILKDFYFSQYYPNAKSKYSYIVLDGKSTNLPKYVIISDLPAVKNFFLVSDKKIIYQKLQKTGYKKLINFSANTKFYLLFNNLQSFYFGAIIPTPLDITIFIKSNK